MPPKPQRHDFGPFEVIVLSDGQTRMPNSIFPDFDPLRAEGGEGENFALPIAAFLIRETGRVALLDSGSAGNFGPDAGRFPESFAASGVRAEEVDEIFITHLHSDHYGGLLDRATGQAAFPRARLTLSTVEWHQLEDKKADAARSADDLAAIGRARRAVAPYRDRLRLVEPGEELTPGLRVLALPGHTAGHAGLELTADGLSLLIVGDLFHCPAWQLPNPGWSVIYDEDPLQAAATRRSILERAARDGSLLAGAHLGALNFCRVAQAGQGFCAAGA